MAFGLSIRGRTCAVPTDGIVGIGEFGMSPFFWAALTLAKIQYMLSRLG
jgi:hypothetical protein